MENLILICVLLREDGDVLGRDNFVMASRDMC